MSNIRVFLVQALQMFVELPGLVWGPHCDNLQTDRIHCFVDILLFFHRLGQNYKTSLCMKTVTDACECC